LSLHYESDAFEFLPRNRADSVQAAKSCGTLYVQLPIRLFERPEASPAFGPFVFSDQLQSRFEGDGRK
jgi:hypothetical protein